MRSLVVVCGASGCGKSTVGEHLAAAKALAFLEGDNYHPPGNRDKMSNNVPLTDVDRAGWLQTLSAAGIKALSTNSTVIISCSALKTKYRQVFRDAVQKANAGKNGTTLMADADRIQLHFIFLYMSQAKAKNLVRARALSTGHFMPPTLVASQFEILELPGDNEPDCHVFDSNVGVEGAKVGTLKLLDSIVAQAGVKEVKDRTLEVLDAIVAQT